MGDQLQTADGGHVDIGEDSIIRRHPLLEKFHGLKHIGCFVDFYTGDEGTAHRREIGPHLLDVVNNEEFYGDAGFHLSVKSDAEYHTIACCAVG